MCQLPWKSLLFLLIFVVVHNIWAEEEISTVVSSMQSCPAKCDCKRSGQKDGASYIKMNCGGSHEATTTEQITNLDELELLNVATEIVQLNISNNQLKSFSPKVELIALQKLNLSRNQLTELVAHQFDEVPNLRRLDISSNHIKHIHLLAFTNLKHLERLKLNQNQISTIILGTFEPFINLKQLDISENPLICDCSLLWLLDWSQKPVKLNSNPKCTSPKNFKGYPLRKLKIGEDIFCKSPVTGIPIIKPPENQVVFEQDALRLQCRAPTKSDDFDPTVLKWSWLDLDVTSRFTDVNIDYQYLGSGLITSTLTISQLKRNHTGIWSCIFGNHSKSIMVIVISDDTQYCPVTVTSGNKGTYNWPRTIVNNTVIIPCEIVNKNLDEMEQRASYTCSKHGEWVNLNTTKCLFTSNTTRILEQFSKVNSSILESAKRFKNFVMNLDIFKDVMDFAFVVDTIANYLELSPFVKIGGILVDVVNNLMELPRFYLREAELEMRSCGKLVNATEKLGMIAESAMLQKSNIALGSFILENAGFKGMKCTWYVNTSNRQDSLFSCAPNSPDLISNNILQGKETEASITIPETLFNIDDLKDTPNTTILISMYSSSKLFPIDEDRKGKEDVSSSVVGVKLQNISVVNLTYPIFVKLKRPPSIAYEVIPFVPVMWDLEEMKWKSEYCKFSRELDDHVVFKCFRFGYYGLMQDVNHLRDDLHIAKFKLSHPAIYVGSLVLFLSFLVVILTYLLCYNSIQMPKKAKHCLINTWISIALLCFMYVFGIYQTEDVKVCQVVGMVLHYFTLCSILWMCVGVNCMYKRLSKHGDVIGLQDDDLPVEQPIQKPILGLYLVGWGVALIICGLSAAINMKDYSAGTHCFLRAGPALSALYIPFSILTFFLAIFFLLVRCAIYNLDANGHLSEGTQATEHVDLDLLEPNFVVGDSRSIRSVSTKTASTDEIEDCEHAPSAQLKAYVIFFLLYVMTWLSCAFATAPPLNYVSFEEDLFSIAYAMLSTTLSAFTLFFYCVARNDVRTQWVVLNRWLKRHRTRNISDTPQNLPPSPPVITQHQEIASRSSSRASNSTKTNSNILKGAVDLNTSFQDNNQGAKINNVNLIVLHRAQYRTNIIPNIIENPTNAAEVFYNPHQSTVARKFFKRQKRNMMKKNNLAPRARDMNSDSASIFSVETRRKQNNTDQSIYGTNSKVNNTNIHVEHIRTTPQKNLNLFSDDDEVTEFNNTSTIPKPVENVLRTSSKFKTKRKQLNNKDDDDSDDDGDEDEGGTSTRIFVNPSHVSVSDLDELYQQIRRGPKLKPTCLSDSEVTSYASDVTAFQSRAGISSDDVETTV